jgi:hypothetical protein
VFVKSKNPAIDWQSRGFENRLLKSEVRSHDACVTVDARPNGHISIGLRVLQHCCKRGFHLLVPKPSGEETLFRGVCQIDLRGGIFGIRRLRRLTQI